MRKELKIGILLYGITMAVSYFFAVPEFFMGFLLALTICMELIGTLPEKAYQSLKRRKRALFPGTRL